jgi:hypothetical protein
MLQPAPWYKYLSDYDVGKLRKLMSVDVLRALIGFAPTASANLKFLLPLKNSVETQCSKS